MVGTYLPLDQSSMARRDAPAAAFGNAAGDYTRAFGAGALNIASNLGSAVYPDNPVSSWIDGRTAELENGYSPFAQQQLSAYDNMINQQMANGDAYPVALATASAEYPYAAGMTFSKEVAPGLVPVGGAIGMIKNLKKPAEALYKIGKNSVLPAMAIGAADGLGEVRSDYYDKTGSRNVLDYPAQAVLGVMGGAGQSLGAGIGGEGVIGYAKSMTPGRPSADYTNMQQWGL